MSPLPKQYKQYIKMDSETECVIESLLKKPFFKLNMDQKIEVIDNGRPTPALPNLTSHVIGKSKSFIRHFQESNYQEKLWLCGSAMVNKLFCWPCLLFSSNRGVLTTGYNDLNHLTTSMAKHLCSQAHINCALILKTFGKTRIDLLVDEQKNQNVTRHNQQVSENREILERLIDTICFIGSQEIALRGNDESQKSENKGNYVELINLIAKYDSKLAAHLAKDSVFKGTSNHIQNDLIKSIADVLRDFIDLEIQNAPFLSVMLDEATDIKKKSQLSLVFRYVDKKGVAKERFYKFWDVSDDRTAAAISNKLIEIIKLKNWGNKLIAQTYDGAAVMSGELNGTQARVRTEFPNALFVHCNAHVLNLVLSQSVSFISEVKVFFTTLSALSAFFAQSTKRTYLLDQVVKRRLPTISTTRWNFSSRLVNVVHYHYNDFIILFEEMINDPDTWGADAIQARGFLQFLNVFGTVFLLNIFDKFFSFTDILFNILQTKMLDIQYCLDQILTSGGSTYWARWAEPDLKFST